jgi:hypothetical protein
MGRLVGVWWVCDTVCRSSRPCNRNEKQHQRRRSSCIHTSAVFYKNMQRLSFLFFFSILPLVSSVRSSCLRASELLAVRLEELLVDELPQHREHEPLETVSDDLGGEAAAEEPAYTIFLYHATHDLRIAQLLRVALLVHLHHANRVAARITHGRSTETDQGGARQFADRVCSPGKMLREVIVHKEPRIVTDECGGSGGDGSLEKSRGPRNACFVEKLLDTISPFHLPGCMHA